MSQGPPNAVFGVLRQCGIVIPVLKGAHERQVGQGSAQRAAVAITLAACSSGTAASSNSPAAVLKACPADSMPVPPGGGGGGGGAGFRQSRRFLHTVSHVPTHRVSRSYTVLHGARVWAFGSIWCGDPLLTLQAHYAGRPKGIFLICPAPAHHHTWVVSGLPPQRA